jgi:hypothetical protein
MNPTRILDIFKRVYLRQVNVPLGRWKIHNHRQTILKSKYANEDNCGISGINYTNITKKQTNNELDDNQYIYYGLRISA